MKAVLVYQNGIANVFQVKCFNMTDHGREAKRLIQGAFSTCESFALGMAAAGAQVATAACNMIGDVTSAHWTTDLESQPFSYQFRPVWHKVKP